MSTQEIRIVAEIANGHEGNVDQALLLLKAAAGATADAAKFQVIYADELATPDYMHYDLFRSLEMTDAAWEQIISLAEKLNVQLIVDVFGERSLELAKHLGLQEIMIHATDLTNMPLIDKVAHSNWDTVILGVGGACLREIEATVDKLSPSSLVIMVGFQGYPTPDDENQLLRISRLVEHFSSFENIKIGFADHSLPDSPWVIPFSSVALGLGAQVFEKHLTLAESMMLLDNDSAINPDKFARYSEGLRTCLEAMGEMVPTDNFGMYPAEERYRNMVRRCVVTISQLKAGSVIGFNDLALKRPGKAGDFFEIDAVVGRILCRDVQANQPLLADDVE